MYQRLFSLKSTQLKVKNLKNDWKILSLKEVISKELKGKAKKEMIGNNSIYLDTAYLNGGTPTYVSASKDVKNDDILILWDGSKAGTIYRGIEGALGSTLKAYSPKYSSSYLYHFLKSNQNKIYFNFRTPNIPHVVKDFSTKFMIKIPSNEEQKVIGNLLDKINIYQEKNKSRRNSLKKLKQFLLQNMFI
ncbi:restriction endonuclease subunit S [Lactobacillus sp. PV037]|nr:restriction endonuclease subunit S [Lactobacillus sp. PV012]QNQ84435.1 restriction endonuclease subunit S [Lactobacillus sp. PV037]